MKINKAPRSAGLVLTRNVIIVASVVLVALLAGAGYLAYQHSALNKKNPNPTEIPANPFGQPPTASTLKYLQSAEGQKAYIESLSKQKATDLWGMWDGVVKRDNFYEYGVLVPALGHALRRDGTPSIYQDIESRLNDPARSTKEKLLLLGVLRHAATPEAVRILLAFAQSIEKSRTANGSLSPDNEQLLFAAQEGIRLSAREAIDGKLNTAISPVLEAGWKNLGTMEALNTRAVIADALVYLARPEGLTLLISETKRKDISSSIRAVILSSLSHLKSNDGVPTYKTALIQSTNPALTKALIQGLVSVGTPDAMRALVSYVNQLSGTKKQEAIADITAMVNGIDLSKEALAALQGTSLSSIVSANNAKQVAEAKAFNQVWQNSALKSTTTPPPPPKKTSEVVVTTGSFADTYPDILSLCTAVKKITNFCVTLNNINSCPGSGPCIALTSDKTTEEIKAMVPLQISPSTAVFNLSLSYIPAVSFALTNATRGDLEACYEVLAHPNPNVTPTPGACTQDANFVTFDGNDDWKWSGTSLIGTFPYNTEVWGLSGIKTKAVFRKKSTHADAVSATLNTVGTPAASGDTDTGGGSGTGSSITIGDGIYSGYYPNEAALCSAVLPAVPSNCISLDGGNICDSAGRFAPCYQLYSASPAVTPPAPGPGTSDVVPANCTVKPLNWGQGFSFNSTPMQTMNHGQTFAYEVSSLPSQDKSPSTINYASVKKYFSISENPCDFEPVVPYCAASSYGNNPMIWYVSNGTRSEEKNLCHLTAGKKYYFNVRNSSTATGADSCPSGEKCTYYLAW